MKVRIRFAGIEFAGSDRGDGDVSLRTDVFRKILQSGKVRFQLNYRHDDQGPVGDQDATPTVDELLEHLKFDKPTLLKFEMPHNRIKFLPHRNLSYTIFETK